MEENLKVDDVPISPTSQETASDRALTLTLRIVVCAVGLAFVAFFATIWSVVWSVAQECITASSYIPSPDKNLEAIVRSAENSDKTKISLKAINDEQREVGYLTAPTGLCVYWTTDTNLTIEYHGAKQACFPERYVELNRKRITIDLDSRPIEVK